MFGYVPEDLDDQWPSEGPDDSSGIDDFSERANAVIEVVEGGPEILTAEFPPWAGETWDERAGRWVHLEAGWNP